MYKHCVQEDLRDENVYTAGTGGNCEENRNTYVFTVQYKFAMYIVIRFREKTILPGP